jgi:hypothetical protein
MSKHFTKGIIIGRITEIKDASTKENSKKYVTIKADVSSSLSGDVTAYCRMYDNDGSITELKRVWNKNRSGLFKLQGIYSQYRKDQSSGFMSSFTLFGFEPVDTGSKRAYFIVVGEVYNQPSGTNDGGQRFLVNVVRQNSSGKDQEEMYEFWAPGDKLLDTVSEGDTIRVKGLVRQKTPDGVCGGEGEIRAYLESLEIQNDGAAVSEEDLPY